MLNDDNRKKLDDIVSQMAAQNAPKADVQAIVEDFKRTYDTPTSPTPSTETEKPSGISAIPSDINQRGNDIVDIWNKDQNPVSKIWQTAGQVGKTATGAVGRGLETLSNITKPVLQGVANSDAFKLARPAVSTIPALSIPYNAVALAGGNEKFEVPQLLKSKSVDLKNTYDIFKKDNPELSANLEAGVNILGGMAFGGTPKGRILDFVREGKTIPATISNIPKVAGESVENFGKIVKYGETKIPTSIAKKSYGADLMEKKNQIINDIADFGITKGNNEESAADALAKAQERFDKADEIAGNLAADPNTEQVIPSKIALQGIDPKKIASTGSRKAAQNIINDIETEMAEDGHAKPGTLTDLIKAKQNLNNDGMLFVNGPAETSADALNKAIRKKMYLNIVDAIGGISPEIKAMNTEGKRLLDVHAALSNAASRVANHDAIGLTDFILGGASIAHPGSLAVSAPLFIAKKSLSNGRAGNLLINAGRGMAGKTEKTIAGSLGDITAQETAKTAPGSTAYDATTQLPKNAAIPTYFRQGIKPETLPLGERYSRDRAKRIYKGTILEP
jgi:hypothetical protein